MTAAIKICKAFAYWAILFLAAAILLFAAPSAQASRMEWSDAPLTYGTAKHATGEWQRLGSLWNSEYSPQAVDQDISDDGVFWSTDGGATWGHEELVAGDEVMFGFQFTRAGYGIHDHDNLRAWVDWNGDNVWTSNENVIDVNWLKGDTQVADNVYWDYFNTHGTVINPLAELTRFFVSGSHIVTQEMGLLDGLWLRARVACSSSIARTSEGEMTAYNTVHQGEVEDWKVSTTTSATPEPGSMILFGSAAGLMGWYRRRKKNKAN